MEPQHSNFFFPTSHYFTPHNIEVVSSAQTTESCCCCCINFYLCVVYLNVSLYSDYCSKYSPIYSTKSKVDIFHYNNLYMSEG